MRLSSLSSRSLVLLVAGLQILLRRTVVHSFVLTDRVHRTPHTAVFSSNPQQGENAIPARAVGVPGQDTPPFPKPQAWRRDLWQPNGVQASHQVWSQSEPVTVQGRSLKTWAFPDFTIPKCHLVLKTDGRPLQASIDLWQGPNNTPQKVSLYSEDGHVRPFSALMATVGKGSNVVRVTNTATMEFPLKACVVPVEQGGELGSIQIGPDGGGQSHVIQGGALRTYPFNIDVQSVQVLVRSDGRPMNCRIELLQGPNTIKQVMEVYTEDGAMRPLYVVMESPGSGNVVRIVNTAPLEFPLTATIAPFEVDRVGPGPGGWGGVLGGSLPELRW